MSIGIIYDNTIRNNGTAVYAWHAIEQLGCDVWHYLPTGQAVRDNAPPYRSHDYYIYIDDGRDDLGIPDIPQPCAYWAIDTHLGYNHRFEMGKKMEHVFTAQKSGAEKMSEDGHPSAHWLPLACHPMAHPMIPYPEKDADMAFVGFLNNDWRDTDALVLPNGNNNRVEWIHQMFQAYPNSLLGIQIFFEEMASLYAQSKIGFNISIRDDLNMRFFEIPSTGTAMLSNTDVVGWEELGFIEGEDFFGYTSMEEAIETAAYVLGNDGLRKEVALNGVKKVRAGHTYYHRMAQMLNVIGITPPKHPDDVSRFFNTWERMVA